MPTASSTERHCVSSLVCRSDHTQAANLYTDAAQRWQQFGNVLERATPSSAEACLIAAAQPEAGAPPLRDARELFASMGYKPALAETEALLEQMSAAPSS
ncbi:MAG TPA: hypothetical protein VFW80_06435 [Gaiellaceae bacterium]|nr:hypothetical protein [Gaiellaceae bacterium]